MANVLLVDDDPSVRGILERIVKRRGHNAVLAATGQEALELLGSNTVNLIITDINMPDMDGIELILAVRETGRALPIVAISGGGLIEASSLLADAQSMGALEVVAKPFVVAEMGDLISRLLAP